MYSVNGKDAQVILGYSDVFSGDKPCLIEKIKEMNMHKEISIISELIQIRDAKYNPINITGIGFELPYETVLKRDYCGMNPESSEEMVENAMLRKNQHIISLQMLLILLKKVIIYGNYDSLKIKDYEISDEDYKEIIMLQLLVADEVSAKHNISIDMDHFLYSTYHLNYQRNVANEFQRMYYMMEYLSRDSELFDDDIKAEYRNYYGDFTSRYNFTPTEYSSLLFYELQYYFSDKNALSQSSCWRNVDYIYRETMEKEKISQVIDLLKIEPVNLKRWAKETEEDEWNFTSFYRFPFISDGESEYISVSDITLINAFFEKILVLCQ